METIKLLKEKYESACNEYVQIFANKQEMDFDFWIAGEVGGIASFCYQYFFNISDIILDVDTEQPKGLILKWQDDYVDAVSKHPNTPHINYKSYTKGLRYGYIEQERDEADQEQA